MAAADTLPIALDAMGGDNAPREIVRGALLGAARLGVDVVLVGRSADIERELAAAEAEPAIAGARAMMDVSAPRVGLLSNGEEPGKGSALVQAASPLLAAAPIRFIGNVEGKDLFHDVCDVAVTDGFTGNVALKTAEGIGEFLFAAISAEARKSLQGKVGGALLKPKLRPIRDRADYRNTGGALLLGVDGEVVI